MEKVKSITEEQFKTLRRRKYTVKAFKDIVGIELEGKYGVGDSAITATDAKELDIFKSTLKGITRYYIIISVINKKVALAVSLYPL